MLNVSFGKFYTTIFVNLLTRILLELLYEFIPVSLKHVILGPVAHIIQHIKIKTPVNLWVVPLDKFVKSIRYICTVKFFKYFRI